MACALISTSSGPGFGIGRSWRSRTSGPPVRAISMTCMVRPWAERGRAMNSSATVSAGVNALDGFISDGKHRQQVRVYYEDTDFSGIVYHASYLRFMERGRTNYLRLIGADHRALFEQAAQEAPGFAFVVRHMDIHFHK